MSRCPANISLSAEEGASRNVAFPGDLKGEVFGTAHWSWPPLPFNVGADPLGHGDPRRKPHPAGCGFCLSGAMAPVHMVETKEKVKFGGALCVHCGDLWLTLSNRELGEKSGEHTSEIWTRSMQG